MSFGLEQEGGSSGTEINFIDMEQIFAPSHET